MEYYCAPIISSTKYPYSVVYIVRYIVRYILRIIIELLHRVAMFSAAPDFTTYMIPITQNFIDVYILSAVLS